MFCPKCEIHFSGTHGGELCPYCGQPAEPSGASRRAASAVGSRESARWPRSEETVTEGKPPSPENIASQPPVSPAGEWDPGSLVAGKYEVVSRLGAGGFGTVYKVRHVFRKKYYALKTPHREFARDETFRVRFEREIEAMERFVHTDAVMIRDSGITETGTPYYTMDFIDGESLKVALQREKQLPVERALRIIRRILRVLEVAHAHQIIHRDIKPDNILLTRVSGRETVKVLDFGVAKLLDLVGDTGSVTRGARVGTPKYMSPEQITGEGLDPRSDLFSLGIVFYELVTGVHPFAIGNDPIRVTASILNHTPTPPRDIVQDLPRAINDHILWMLDKKPKRRPESAKVLISNLGPVEEGVSRVEPVQTLEVCEVVPRGPATLVVLRQETSVGERRSFLIFSDRVGFGRSNDLSRGIRNDLIWRCLPCRSRAADPENWQRNLTISQRLGSVYPEGSALVIDPDPQAKLGICIGGVRSLRPARIQADRFHMSIGDKALELDGYRVLRSPDQPQLDLSFLADSRPPDVRPSEAIGYSTSACHVDHVHFRRASNWPLHEYFLVYRQLKLGSSANVGLRLRGAGVEGLHAVVIHEEGEVFLMPQEGKVFVRGPSASGASRSAPVELAPHRLVPFRPGLELILGDVHLRVEAAAEEYFKTV
ncbi:MAG: FHA domain-containing serine/threonine-protein kinase [Planctomycetota bacterium]|nr:FHA domain-containing serine/threonine-protein kinase [Planctomycetota bacterium]